MRLDVGDIIIEVDRKKVSKIEELEGISKYKTLEHQDTCDKLHEAEDRIEELELLLKGSK